MFTQFEIRRRRTDDKRYYNRMFFSGRIVRDNRGGSYEAGAVRPADQIQVRFPVHTVRVNDIIILMGSHFIIEGVEPLPPGFRNVLATATAQKGEHPVELVGIPVSADGYLVSAAGYIVVASEPEE